MTRCDWAKGDLDVVYHDTEWGVPVHDDRLHFELIILEGAQAGLSWSTILKKRENYRKAMAGFDPAKVARFGEKQVERMLANTDPATSVVRHRGKLESAIANARAFLEVQAAEGSFDAYIWTFVDGEPIVGGWRAMRQVPATTPVSEAMSRDLRKRGFNFVGPTICYAYMQAAGLVNDHLVTCFRHAEVAGKRGRSDGRRGRPMAAAARRRASPAS